MIRYADPLAQAEIDRLRAEVEELRAKVQRVEALAEELEDIRLFAMLCVLIREALSGDAS